MEQRCPQCVEWVKLGHCIERNVKWAHMECPGQAARGMATIEAGLRPMRADYSGYARALTDGAEDTSMTPSASSSSRPDDHPDWWTAEQKRFVKYWPAKGEVVRGNARAGTGKTTTAAIIADEWVKRDSGVRIGYFVFNTDAKNDAMKSNKFPKNHVDIMTTHAFAIKHVFPGAFPQLDGNLPRSKVMKRLGLVDVVLTELMKSEAEEATQNNTPPQRCRNKDLQRCRPIAQQVGHFIVKTLDKFLASDDACVGRKHVFWKSQQTGNRTEWKKWFTRDFYIEKASLLFNLMKRDAGLEHTLGAGMVEDEERERLPMTHDAYLKVFQMRKVMMDRSQGRSGFDVIIMDEAQDLTPCQAAAFWGPEIRGECIVYLIGDKRQRIYRWRHAAENFEQEAVKEEFSLTDSFRFGSAIAEAATRVLSHSGCEQVYGRCVDSGTVIRYEVGLGAPSVIITRTNKATVNELWKLRKELGCFPTWNFIDSKCKGDLVQNHAQYRKFIKLHKETGPWKKGREKEAMGTSGSSDDDEDSSQPRGVASNKTTIRICGEDFSDWRELKAYVEEVGDTKTATIMALVAEYAEDDLEQLLQDMSAHRSSTPQVIFTTAHKAKGMEFEGPVFIADDFSVPMKRNEQGEFELEDAHSPGWVENLNLLYVAMTRAKKTLWLSKGIWKYLKLLGQLPEHSEKNGPERTTAAAGGVPHPNVVTPEHCEQLRNDYEEAWQAFVNTFPMLSGEAEKPIVGVDDIPWPPGYTPSNDNTCAASTTTNIFALHNDMGADEKRRIVRRAQLRYHPDKLGNRVAVGLDDAIKARMADVIALTTEVMDSMHADASHEARAEFGPRARARGTENSDEDEPGAKRARRE